MPMYQYRCKRCGTTKEYFLPMEHNDPIHCGVEMDRVFSEMNFILKGEGWSLQGYEKPNEYMMKQNIAQKQE